MSSRIRGLKSSGYSEAGAAASRGLSVTVRSITLLFIGVSVLIWTGLELALSATAANFNGKYCLPLAVGIALIVWGALIETNWRSFGGWCSLALVGQAASLQMIDAGRLIHFQHYRSVPDLAQNETAALSLLILQAVCVGVGISKKLSVFANWMVSRFAWWQAGLIAIMLAFSSAAVTPNVSVYSSSLVFGTLIQFVNIANVILLAWSVPEEGLSSVWERVDRFLGGDEAVKVVRLDRFALIAALWVILLTGVLSYFVYQAHPHVPDETQYIFQANYMAAGQLSVKAPPVPEAFAMYMVPFREARWYGIFPPGWPALLAVGTLLGANWVVNPLLAGACILLAYLFFQQVYSLRFARMAVLLLCCSPWFILMGMSYMSHVSTLVFALAAAVLLLRGMKTNNAAYSLAAGLAVGGVFLVRPLDGAIVGLILGVGSLFGSPTWRMRILLSGVLIIGTTGAASLIFPYNKLVTGSGFLSPSDAYYDNYVGAGVMALGFGADRGLHWPLDAFPGHSPLEAAINAALNIFQLNSELLGWGSGSLLLIIFVLVSGGVLRKDYWAWGSTAVVVGAYSLFWYHGGPDFGARYWFLCIIPLTALTVRGLEMIAVFLNIFQTDGPSRPPRVALTAAMLCMITLASYIPWRASDKYFSYLGMRPGIQTLARQNNFEKSLVLIRGSEHPDYQSTWIYNPLNFEGDAPIFAFDKSPEVSAALLRNYPDRRVWIVDGPTIANGQYRIIRGPLNPDEVLGAIK